MRNKVITAILAAALALALTLTGCGENDGGSRRDRKESKQNSAEVSSADRGGAMPGESGSMGNGAEQSGSASGSGQGILVQDDTDTVLTAQEAGLQVVLYSATKADFIIENAYIPHRGGAVMVEFDWTDGKTYGVSLENCGSPDNDFNGPFQCGFWELMEDGGHNLICGSDYGEGEAEYSVNGEQATISVDLKDLDIGGMSFGAITRYRVKNYVGSVMGNVAAEEVTRLAEGVDESALDNSNAVYRWDDLYYVYNDEGGVTIVAPSSIVVEDGIPEEINGRPVTVIGECAFASYNGGIYYDLHNVIIPKTVKRIEDNAFTGNESLQTISFPSGLESIGASAFWNSGLTSVTIPSGLVYMGEGAFSYSPNLTSVTVQNGAKHIGKSAFSMCDKLKTVNIASADEIGARAFNDCKALTSVTLGSGVKKIGDEAFYGDKSLKSIVIPGSVESIGIKAFMYCEALESAVIEAGARSLGEEAFCYCTSLKSVKIGSGITILRDLTFGNCDSLVEVELPDTLQKMEGKTFGDCDLLEKIVIPSGMNSISDKLTFGEAFFQCYKLKEAHYAGHDYSFVTRKELYAAINTGTSQVPADNLFEYDDEIIGTYKQVSVSDTNTDENAYLPNVGYDGTLLTVVSNGRGGVNFVWWNTVSYYALFENKDDISSTKSYYRDRFSDDPLAFGSVRVSVNGNTITATFEDIMFNHAPEFKDVVRAPYTVTYTKESNDTYYWYQ